MFAVAAISGSLVAVTMSFIFNADNKVPQNPTTTRTALNEPDREEVIPNEYVAKSQYDDLQARFNKLSKSTGRIDADRVQFLEGQLKIQRQQLTSLRKQLREQLETAPDSISANSDIQPISRDQIGGGFKLVEMRVRSGSIGPEIIGQITNNSNRDYSTAVFAISVFNGDQIVEVANAIVSNFSAGTTKSFSALSETATPANRLKIQFETGY